MTLRATRWLFWLALGAWATVRAQAPGPPWFDGPRPAALAEAAVALLADAPSHGLDPRDYALPDLHNALAQASRGTGLPPAQALALQQALDSAWLRYLNDLNRGRIPAGALRGVASAREPFDAASALRAAAAMQDLSLAVRAAAPALPQYDRLREALTRQRALIGHPAMAAALPPLPRAAAGRLRALEAGARWDGLGALATRLVAAGDLDERAEADRAAGPAADRYEGALVDAVKAFQRRHGLVDDGIVGRATRDALLVPPAARARQIELALERLRWTPLLRSPRMIVVNVPEFVLRAYEVQGGRVAVQATIKVIVGQALDKRTPLIEALLREIEFRPFWNVPPSIARNELVPRLRRDAGYWAREGFEFVGPGGADPVLTESKLQAVLAGALRIRQRPGPRNALGDIKFVFPNRESIYLHHTPSLPLFDAARRDFSHGCIRVEDPVALAAFALRGQAQWTEARIRDAMARGDPPRLALAEPVPVQVAYFTALVKDGRIHFYDDVYGHDRELDQRLRSLARPPIAVPKLAAR